jgi:hypothetical protein
MDRVPFIDLLDRPPHDDIDARPAADQDGELFVEGLARGGVQLGGELDRVLTVVNGDEGGAGQADVQRLLEDAVEDRSPVRTGSSNETGTLVCPRRRFIRADDQERDGGDRHEDRDADGDQRRAIHLPADPL